MSWVSKTWKNRSEGAPTTPVSATGLNDLESRLSTAFSALQASRGSVSPNAHGAVGNNVADDTAAVQAAADYAIANNLDLILNPATSYKVTDTIDLLPASGASFRGKVIGVGPTPITWAGGNGTDSARKFVFLVQGMKRSRIEHVNIQLPANCTYVHGWELDDTTGTYTSLSQLTFEDCHVFGSTGNTGCGGWRVGHVDDTGNADFSFINWMNCGTAMGTAPTGSFHIIIEGANALNNNVFGGYAYYVETGIGNRSTTGAAATAGNASIFCYGYGSSHVSKDFDFASQGTYVILGGRFEVGKRFLNVDLNGSLAGAEVVMDGCTLSSFVPDDDIIFYADGGSGIHMRGMEVRPASGDPDYTAAMITLGGSSSMRPLLRIDGGKFRAADPFFTIEGAAAWSIQILGARYQNSSQHVTAIFKNYLSTISTDTSDVLSVAITGGSAGGAPQIGYQPSSPALAATVRGRVGYDGGNGLVVDGGTSRTATLKANGNNVVTARADQRIESIGGRKIKRTLPGAYPYTALVTDEYIAVSTGTAKTVNLPSATAVGAGHVLTIKDYTGGASANNITIARAGSDTIDGATSRTISTNYGSVRLVSDGGTNWEVL